MNPLQIYLTISIITTLCHILFILARSIPTKERAPVMALKIGIVTFVAWPLLPLMALAFMNHVKQRRLPLEQRKSQHVMLKGVKKHFDKKPFIVIGYDVEKENLHFFSNCQADERNALLKHGIEANNGILGMPTNGND